MQFVSKLRTSCRSIFRHQQVETDLDDELAYHLEQEIQNNLTAGMVLEEARSRAQRTIGSVGLYKEECRDVRGVTLIESVARDARFGVRSLRRTPVFTAIAVATLALGIGANTTIFTFVDNIVLRPLPVHDPHRLVALNWDGAVNMSYPNYLDFRNRNAVFSDLIATRFNPVSMSLRARQNFRVWGYEVTGNYFETLGVEPALGRFFGPSEDCHPIVVISHRWWQSHLASDPNVLGESVKINGFPFTIIGVAPQSFSGTELIVTADYWVPMNMEAQIEPGREWLRSRSSRQVWTLGRLKAGISSIQAESNLNQIAQQLARTYPHELSPNMRFQLSRPGLIGQAFRGPVSAIGSVLMVIAGLLLLLACANLAGMLLARASDRRWEFAIRLSVGASRRQLLRQLMVESLLLAAAGGLAGYAIAIVACSLFNSWSPTFDIPATTSVQPDLLVLAFTLASTVSTIFLFGLLPALQATRTGLVPALENDPSSERLRRWSARDIIIAGQIAISVVLVICSALVVHSLQHALTLKFGLST